MVTRQIREGGCLEAHRRHAMLLDRVRRHFHADAFGAELPQGGKLAMDADGVRGRVLGRSEFRRNPESQRAHEGGPSMANLKRLRQQPRTGRLAVGSGDAGNRQRLSGTPEKAVGDDSHVPAEMRNLGDKDVRAEVGYLRDGVSRC